MPAKEGDQGIAIWPPANPRQVVVGAPLDRIPHFEVGSNIGKHTLPMFGVDVFVGKTVNDHDRLYDPPRADLRLNTIDNKVGDPLTVGKGSIRNGIDRQ